MTGRDPLAFEGDDLDVLVSAHRAFSMICNKHTGGSLSCCDFVASLYFSGLARLSLSYRDSPTKDKVVFSKGHAWAPQLFALWLHGFLEDIDLETLVAFGEVDNPLPRLPVRNPYWGIEMSTGALGQGLSFGVGISVADRSMENSSRTFVILGDGECSEGQVWEAANTATRLEVGNLTAIVDANSFGSIIHLKRDQWRPKWEAFGFTVIELNGHDIREVLAAIDTSSGHGRYALILHTLKGNGLDATLAGTDRLSSSVPKGYLPTLETVKPLLTQAYRIVQDRRTAIETARQAGTVELPTANQTQGSQSAGFLRLDDFDSDSEGELRNPKQFISGLSGRFNPERGLFFLSPDAIRSSGLFPLIEKWGRWSWQNVKGRVIECTIAEQDAASMAAGIASQGFRCAVFLMEGFVWRMLDSIRQSIAYPMLPVVIVGTSAGLSDELGAMVQSDTCILTLINMLNLEMFEASDANEARILFTEAVASGKPAYLRVPHQDPLPISASITDIAARPGLSEGIWQVRNPKIPSATIVTAGSLVPLCLNVAQTLEEEIDLQVLNVCSLTRAKRLKRGRLQELIPPDLPIVSVYNGPPAIFNEIVPRDTVRIGVETYGVSGSPVSALLTAAGITEHHIAESVRSLM